MKLVPLLKRKVVLEKSLKAGSFPDPSKLLLHDFNDSIDSLLEMSRSLRSEVIGLQRELLLLFSAA